MGKCRLLRLRFSLSAVACLGFVSLSAVSACRAEKGERATPTTSGRRQEGIDSILAESAGVVVGLTRQGATHDLAIGVRSANHMTIVYTSDSLPSRPQVQFAHFGSQHPFVLWTLQDESFVGGVLLEVFSDSARVVRQSWVPENQLCRSPRIESIGGESVLIEELAAVFSAEDCLDPVADCVWQLPSTWHVLYRVVGGAATNASSNFPDYFMERDSTYRAWAERIKLEEKVRGQQQTDSQSIKDRCGLSVADSLLELSRRAREIAGVR